LVPSAAIPVAVLPVPVVFLYSAPTPMAVLALPVVLLESASVPSAVLPLALPPPGSGVPASEETNENRPVIITTNVLFKTVRRYLLSVAPSKIPCTVVFFRLWYLRSQCAMAPLPGRFISHLVLRERCNEVRRIVRYFDDFQIFLEISA